jgi:trimeric autotransporter adhesin
MKQKITLFIILFLSILSFSQKKDGKGQRTAATLTFVADGNWSLASNWSPAQVPTSVDNVTIPSPRLCILNSTGATVNNLTVDSGGTLNVNAGASLTVSGTFASNGTTSIKSDATGSASVIVTGMTGSVTYQRYLTGGANKWHLISSPVTGSQTIAAFIASFGGAMTQSGVKYSLAPYDNSGIIDVSTWKNYTTDGSNPAPSSSFVVGKGYEILMNADGTVDFTGQISSASEAITLTENITGWNLIGNPYTSFLAMNSSANATNFLSTNAANLDPSFVAIYVWNPTNNSYDIFNQASATRSLAPGQAFFVKSKAGGGVNANFTTGMQINTGNAFQKAATTGIPTIDLTADNNSGTKSSTEIKYMSGTTLGLDPGYDAGRFGGAGTGFNVYTHLVSQDNGVALSVQVVPDTGYDTTVIPIGLDASTGTQITFKATATDLPTGKKVFLEDKLLSTVTEINNTDKSYTVTLSSSLSGIGRFYLHTQDSASTLSVEDFNTSQYTLIARPKNNSLKLYGAVSQKGSIVIYDSLGRAIYTTSLQKGTEQDITIPTMATGVYFVKATIDGKPLSKKIVWY